MLAASGIALAWSGPDGAHSSACPPSRPQALAPARPHRQQHRAGRRARPPRPPNPASPPGWTCRTGVCPRQRAARPAGRAWASPAAALAAYQLAAKLVDQADPACGIDWARWSPRSVASRATTPGSAATRWTPRASPGPGIIGLPLNGTNGTARITDTDDGRWDHDTTYDRAVGPMQFIPGTWRIVGADADGDGARDPQDMNDAATGTAIYLCSGPGDLRRGGDLYGAIERYNNSD